MEKYLKRKISPKFCKFFCLKRMIRVAEKREHKMQGYTFCIVVCKQMHVMDFVVLITALLPFLMELKMKGKRNKQLSKKEGFTY